MSLNIYTSEEQIPQGVKLITQNDLYFDGLTNLSDDAVSHMIMKTIDHAEYHSPLTFIGRDPHQGALNKNLLSTGTKTLLNILQYPSLCFDVCECGNNALCLLTKIQEGNILWRNPVMVYWDDDSTCDFNFQGRVYEDVFDFLQITCSH